MRASHTSQKAISCWLLPVPHSSQVPAHSSCSINAKWMKMRMPVDFSRPSSTPCASYWGLMAFQNETPLSTQPAHCSPAVLTSVVTGPPQGWAPGCAQRHLLSTDCVLDIKVSKQGTQFRGKDNM